jgi:hypothetical protein
LRILISRAHAGAPFFLAAYLYYVKYKRMPKSTVLPRPGSCYPVLAYFVERLLMKLFAVAFVSVVLLAACESKPLTPEQSAALADRENCQEVTGSRLRRCGTNVLKDAGVKTMDAEAARSMMNSATSGSGKSDSGSR